MNYMLILQSAQSSDFLGLGILNPEILWQLIFRFSINSIWIFIISYFLYFKHGGKREYLFTFLLISAVVFEICNVLDAVSLQLGFALGLFAVFGIIRYRTNPIPAREMTYLFIVIGISVKNALANNAISFFELLITDILLIILAYFAENFLKKKRLLRKRITYNNLDLIKPERYADLLKDLSFQLGFHIERAEIGRIDLIKKQVRIMIYFPNNIGIYNYDDIEDS